MKTLSMAAVAGLMAVAGTAAAAVISESGSAPSGGSIRISQPVFRTDASNSSNDAGDYSDQAGAPGQTFTAAEAFDLTGVTVKGRGYLGGISSWVITISRVDGAALTRLSQEATADFNPGNINDYLTFSLATPVRLQGGLQYAYSIYTQAGYYGFAESDGSIDAYTGGAAIQHGSNSRAAADGATIGVNPQNAGVDRTFYIWGSPVPEPTGAALLALGLGVLGIRHRRAAGTW